MKPTLIIATRNAHKTAEIRAILGNTCDCLALTNFSGAPTIVEDLPTFAGNATLKAVGLARWLARTTPPGLPAADGFVLADDSGLEVDVLNGAPGVHSARFAATGTTAKGNSPDSENNAKLVSLLQNVPPEKRTARFRCVLALTPITVPLRENSSSVCLADEAEQGTEIFDGACEGRIILEPRGKNGFGYDPLFIPDGYEQTYAELGDSIKNRISHRSRALAKLKQRLAMMG